jgi:hypothetical protein
MRHGLKTYSTYPHTLIPRPVLPNLFSTATQFLERQSIATHIALLDKKVVLKRKIYNIQRTLCALFFPPFLISFCFFTFPFLMIFNFYIIKKSHFRNFSRPTKNRLATQQFGKSCSRLNIASSYFSSSSYSAFRIRPSGLFSIRINLELWIL